MIPGGVGGGGGRGCLLCAVERSGMLDRGDDWRPCGEPRVGLR